MCPKFFGAVDNFGKSYENKLRSTLDQWFKLVHLNAQPEIQILNWFYPWHEWCGKCNCLKPHKSSWYQEFFARFALSLSFDRVVKLAARNIFQVKELQEWNWYKDYLLYRMKFWQKTITFIKFWVWFDFFFFSSHAVKLKFCIIIFQVLKVISCKKKKNTIFP